MRSASQLMMPQLSRKLCTLREHSMAMMVGCMCWHDTGTRPAGAAKHGPLR